MIRWGEIKQQIKQSSAASGCSEEQARLLADEAIRLLTDAIICVGSSADIKVGTFGNSFALPFNFDRAIEVSQCDPDGTGFEQGWFNLTNSSAYIDPAQCGDAALIDLGMLPYEHQLMGPAYIGIRPDYDEAVTVTIHGQNGNDPVYMQTGSTMIDHQILVSDYPNTVWSTSTVDKITDIIKTITNGPVRILAKDIATGIIYVVCLTQGIEQRIERRHYKFPQMNSGEIWIRSATMSSNSGIYAIQIDTNYDSPNVKVGQQAWFTGWLPTSLNGVWTVTQVSGSSFYIQHSGVPNVTIVECLGKIRVKQSVNISALWKRLPITSDDSVIPMRNITALKMGVQGLSRLYSGDVPGYGALIAGANEVLKNESMRYGNDPIHQMNRKAQYIWDIEQYPTYSLGYARGRMAMEITGGLIIGKTDWTRLINEASEQIMRSGLYGASVVDRQVLIEDGGRVVLDADVQTALSASIQGFRPVDIKDRFYATQREMILYSSPIDAGLTRNSFATTTVSMIDGGELIDECGRKRRVYWLPCCFRGCYLNVAGKHRYVPVKMPADTLIIDHYPALKLMCEALVAKAKSDITAYRVLQGESFASLKRAMEDDRGGAQGTIRRANSAQTPIGRRR